VASQTLNTWAEQSRADEKRQQPFQEQQQSQQLQAQEQASHDDTPIPLETYYQDLAATLQLLSNLSQRSASNEARLRNEINLAFNVVNQQDTKAMRIISIVTLTFLPSTFVSTLFSMTFFRQPSDQQPWGVSPQLWIYFVISVPLTAVTLALWVFGPRIWGLALRRRRKTNGFYPLAMSPLHTYRSAQQKNIIRPKC
jgi:Mg2+ and Co2+ transporter CorA